MSRDAREPCLAGYSAAAAGAGAVGVPRTLWMRSTRRGRALRSAGDLAPPCSLPLRSPVFDFDYCFLCVSVNIRRATPQPAPVPPTHEFFRALPSAGDLAPPCSLPLRSPVFDFDYCFLCVSVNIRRATPQPAPVPPTHEFFRALPSAGDLAPPCSLPPLRSPVLTLTLVFSVSLCLCGEYYLRYSAAGAAGIPKTLWMRSTRRRSTIGFVS
jgi:hypothetical protein